MKKKLIKILTLILVTAFALGCFAGCRIITTDNRKDMEQVVAEVNIGKDKTALKDTFESVFFGEDFNLTDEDVDKIVTTAEVSKLDLVSYFINYGYSMLQSGQASSYADVFETLMNSLTSRKMMLQFATLYYLNAGKVVVDADSVPDEDKEGAVITDGTIEIVSDISVEGYLKAADKSENDALRYLISDNNYNYALYGLRQSVNNALDSYEKAIIKNEDDSSSSSETDRAIPTGADTEETNSYPKDAEGNVDYQIYTGYNTADECGEYEKVEGSTVVTRKKAYNKFIKALENNYMLGEEDDITDVEKLPYFATEMKNQLEQVIINNFGDTLQISMTSAIEKENLEKKYNEIVNGQKSIFTSVSDYTTALDSVSDDTFILYSPQSGFGFVYNTLLPFSAGQSDALADYNNRLSNNVINQSEYYYYRNQLLSEVEATDQRASWFNGATDYSYQATDENYFGNSDYLFFEDNAGKIDKYDSYYAYNGKVTKNDDDTYTLEPNPITIDGFITEMQGYLDFVLGKTGSVTGSKTADFYKEQNYYKTENGNQVIDYSKLVYYKGKVNGVSEVSKDNYFVKDTVAYKALSAMNALQFAYTTDTAILNKYLGYSVAGKGNSTSYVKEFEYAAQTALQEGAGAISIVATDYGWHVIYVTYVFGEGNTYQDFNFADRNKEGTFSYQFYNAYKNVIADDYATTKQSEVTTILQDSSVTVYKNRYKDLSNLDQ